MNLKKLFVLVAALAVSTSAFAGNASSNSALIESSVSTAASSVEEEDIDPQILKNTQQALTMGLLTFDAHRDLKQMTDTDKKIEKSLEKDIPAVLNKIKTSSNEVSAELEPLITSLTENLFKNQTVYPAQAINKDLANYIALATSIQYAQQKGLLSDTAAQVLAIEMMQATLGE